MDSVLFSKILRQMLSSHTRISLPGLGEFFVLQIGASLSDRGFTINPPYKKLAFRQSDSGDTLLAEFIARSNRVDLLTAKRVVADYVEHLSRQLQIERSVLFEGLGRLLLSRTGDLFFVQDADARIFPDSDCLEAISMRNLSVAPAAVANPASPVAPAPAISPTGEAFAVSPTPTAATHAAPDAASSAAAPVANPTPTSPADAAATLAAAAADAASPVATPAAAATPASPAATPADAASPATPTASPATVSPATAPEQSRHLAWPYVVLITLAVLLILAFVALAVLGRTLPEYVDPLLYNSSQLEIINTVL